MTKKTYRTAMGKTVDIGALMLQNEGIRAVGNMGVNARGDVINNQNSVIERRARSVQRQNKAKVAQSMPTATSNRAVAEQQQMVSAPVVQDTFEDLPEDNDVVNETVVTQTDEQTQPELRGGLAAAIAKAKAVNQERMKTPREQARAQGVRKI
jgi:hypothetical protein